MNGFLSCLNSCCVCVCVCVCERERENCNFLTKWVHYVWLAVWSITVVSVMRNGCVRAWKRERLCVCVCVWEREWVSEWVSEWERERERETVRCLCENVLLWMFCYKTWISVLIVDRKLILSRIYIVYWVVEWQKVTPRIHLMPPS